jgi:hypothetical protein
LKVITSHNKTLEPLVGILSGRGPIYLGGRIVLRAFGFYPANYDSTTAPFSYINRELQGKVI